jgi:hypothetical protein
MKRIIKLAIDDLEDLGTFGEAFRTWRHDHPGLAETDIEKLRGQFIRTLCRDYLDSLRSQPSGAEGGKG